MSNESSEVGAVATDEPGVPEDVPITLRLIGTAMIGGLVGMVALLPILVGVPAILDLFRTEPIVQFASFVEYVGIEPSLQVGVTLFVLGGTLFLPVQFLVVGAYLPPEEPRFLRGVSFALVYWLGFLMVFWPGGSTVAIATFVVVSLVYHVCYGAILGYLLDRWAEIPQHAV